MQYVSNESMYSCQSVLHLTRLLDIPFDDIMNSKNAMKLKMEVGKCVAALAANIVKENTVPGL